MNTSVPELVIASHNDGKVAEIAALLAPWVGTVHSAAALGIDEPEETGTSFAQNAAQKAEHCAAASGLWALADDSGLVVEALDGAPGIYSARWAGPERDFAKAMQRVEQALQDSPRGKAGDRRAAFVCALALARPGRKTLHFEGRVEGVLVWPPRGSLGFGYDPVFLPNGHDQTFGEMEPERKHAISHRARAFARLLAAKPFS